MQRFEAKQTQQYIDRVGVLLAGAVITQQTVAEQQAVATLGSHVAAARTYQGQTRTELAGQLGMAETDLLALEQGLLPFAELTGPFLQRLARAIGEDVELLRVLLFAGHHAVQKQQSGAIDATALLRRRNTSAALQQPDEMSHALMQKWAKVSRWGKVYGGGVNDIQTLATYALSRLTARWRLLCAWGNARGRGLAYAGKRFERPVLQPFAHGAAHAYRYPFMPFRFGGMMLVVLCCFFLVNLVWPAPDPISTETANALPVVREEVMREEMLHDQPANAIDEVTHTATPIIARERSQVALESRAVIDELSVAEDAALGNQSVTSRQHYHIIYAMDVQNADVFRSNHLSPVIPVSSGRVAVIDLVETVPKIFLHCRVAAHLNSCPM